MTEKEQLIEIIKALNPYRIYTHKVTRRFYIMIGIMALMIGSWLINYWVGLIVGILFFIPLICIIQLWIDSFNNECT